MKHGILAPVAAAALMMAAPALAQSESVTLRDAQGVEKGTVTIDYADEGAVIRAHLKGISEGWHGFHIHEKGDCSADDFSSAGGHAMKDHQEHGAKDAAHLHMGDLPNVYVGANNEGRAEAFARGVTQADLADADGSAFVVHEGPDDYHTDPSGDSGGRVACGVIVPAQE